MNGIDDDAAQDIRRRLQDLAETTEVSPDAWERLAARTTDAKPGRHGDRSHPWRSGRGPLLAAVAAAAAVVLGLAALQARDTDGGDVRTDPGPATTSTEVRPHPDDAPGTTSSTSTTAGTTTPDGADDPTGTTAPGGGPGGVDDLPDDAGAEPPNLPSRATPTMTLASSEYTVEIIVTAAEGPTRPTLYFRRTDLVDQTNVPPLPDGLGSRTVSSWGELDGPRCLASGGGTYEFSDGVRAHAFSYGLVGSGVARVRVVDVDGRRTEVAAGPTATAAGLRAWLMERPVTDVDRIEALDGGGQVVATVPGGGPGSDDFGLDQGTC